MSGAPTQIGPGTKGGAGGFEADDLLAGEYVLGTLPAPEREATRARAARDPEFAGLIADWEGLFAPLNADYVPAPTPPDLLPLVEKRLFGTPAREQGRHFVRMIAILSAGVAAGLALIVFTLAQTGSLRPPPTQFAATLDHRGRALTFAVEWHSGGTELRVRRTSGAAPGPDHDYQLWLIEPDKAPVSLGLLRGPSLPARVAALRPGAVLGVSLEPRGGAPAGAPSGPMLVRGYINKL